MYSILVPKRFGEKALMLLRTNHLVLEKKLLLHEPF
jgi:hypothetical protein